MTRIIAGMFANRATASAAVGELRIAGVKKGDIDAFVVPSARRRMWRFGREQDHTDDDAAGREIGPLTGAVVGGAIGAVAGLVATPLMGPMAIVGGMAAGAYAGSLAGVMRSLSENGESPKAAPSAVRRAGVMVAVHVALQEDEDIAFDVLRHNGAHSIEWAEGAWRHGKWASFDPVAPPQRIVSLDRNRPPRRRPRSDAALTAPHEWHFARHHGHK